MQLGNRKQGHRLISGSSSRRGEAEENCIDTSPWQAATSPALPACARAIRKRGREGSQCQSLDALPACPCGACMENLPSTTV
ncbi:hypothetical protein GOP47_0028089 [Adiantum capillus-veneris]|nr:hypothetical protein GOP47_0028089 [Adiantum capillus-veneris]